MDEVASSFYKPCPFGHYQDEDGQIDCKPCAHGLPLHKVLGIYFK